jgi:hypothetical protein
VVLNLKNINNFIYKKFYIYIKGTPVPGNSVITKYQKQVTGTGIGSLVSWFLVFQFFGSGSSFLVIFDTPINVAILFQMSHFTFYCFSYLFFSLFKGIIIRIFFSQFLINIY